MSNQQNLSRKIITKTKQQKRQKNCSKKKKKKKSTNLQQNHQQQINFESATNELNCESNFKVNCKQETRFSLNILGGGVGEHSEHRFSAPSSLKEGYRNQCLKFGVGAVVCGGGGGGGGSSTSLGGFEHNYIQSRSKCSPDRPFAAETRP